MQTQTVFQTLLGAAFFFFAACQYADDKAKSAPEAKDSFAGNSAISAPKSVHYFSDAEQKLLLKEYTFAAAQLNKGIVAYRVETGKMCCKSAKQANKAIDVLTQLRQKLRNGKPVLQQDLRAAIQQALVVEGVGVQQNTDESLAVPVGN